MTKKLMVTGATGFVGSWLTEALVELGHDVTILVRNSSDLTGLPKDKITICQGDVTNFDSVVKAAKDMDSVFHLAGIVGYSKSQRDLMNQVNVEGTANVIRASKKMKVKNLVYMSSVVAVGASLDGSQPLNENSNYNMKPYNLGYFETKKEAESLVLSASESGDLRCVILCPSTIYGPGDAKKGSRKVQLKVAKGDFPFYTSGGVSLVSVKDVVNAVIQAWKTGKSGERYILSGENITIRSLFEMIADSAGVKPPQIYLPNVLVKMIGATSDILEVFGQKGPLNSENAAVSTMFHWFDHSKAQRELNFQPRPARECIDESIQWSKQNGFL